MVNILNHVKIKIVFVFLSYIIFLSVKPTFSQTYLGNFSSYKIEGKTVRVSAGSSSLKFVFYKPDILRVDFLPTDTTKFDSSFVVIRDTSDGIKPVVNNSDSELVINSPEIKIVCSKYPLRVSYYSTEGKLLLSEPKSGGVAADGINRVLNFNLTSGDHFYGTGERGTDLDKRGMAFDSFNHQQGGYTYPLSEMNINIPFIADPKGYALYFEDTYPGKFDLGNSDPSEFSYTAEGGEISYYLIVASSVQKQLKEYIWLTGRQPLPPRWAFGYIQSKYGYKNQSEAEDMVRIMRLKHIPCDAIVLDLYWYKNMGDLQWDQTNFPNPYQMMDNFYSQGIKTITITEPYFVESSSNYSEASADGYFAKDNNGKTYTISNWWSCEGCNAALLDISNPTAQKWFWNKYINFMGLEVAGLWTDLGEPEKDFSGMNFYMGNRNKIHNIYNLLWAKTIFNGFKQYSPNQRLFNLTRSGYAGIQRYGVIPWSGDVGKAFGGLAVQLPMLLNMGMSGLAYHNSDIGGFCCGTTTPELYVRWMEYGTFCPITRAHGVVQPTEPWGYGYEAETIAKIYIQLRYQLLPYIYTMAYENYFTGMPLARPLFFDYPDDNNLYNNSSSYMWGDDFLVSPVVNQGQTSKSFFLPQGKWVDFFSDKVYYGGKNITVQTPLDKLPLFVKTGSIIPMQQVMDYSNEFPLDTLILRIYPSSKEKTSFSLYEDDGSTLDYQKGSFAKTIFSQEVNGSQGNEQINVNIGTSTGMYNGKQAARIYLAEIHLVFDKPSEVKCNEKLLINRTSFDNLRSEISGFYYDDVKNILFIQIKTNPDSSYQLSANGLIVNDVTNDVSSIKNFRLFQNYPNPFNPATKIDFQIGRTAYVTLKVYDILGKKIKTLVSSEKQSGFYEVEFNGAGLSSGIYFYKLEADYIDNQGKFSDAKQLILLK